MGYWLRTVAPIRVLRYFKDVWVLKKERKIMVQKEADKKGSFVVTLARKILNYA